MLRFPHAPTHNLRITLSETLSLDLLKQLHAQGLAAELPDSLRELFQHMGVYELKAVYTLNDTELASDAYGFAREFTCYLDAKQPIEKVHALMLHSPWIAKGDGMDFAHTYE